jgi:hypothetical protein
MHSVREDLTYKPTIVRQSRVFPVRPTEQVPVIVERIVFELPA